MLRHQEVGSVNFLVAVPAQTSVVRLTVHPSSQSTQLALLHFRLRLSSGRSSLAPPQYMWSSALSLAALDLYKSPSVFRFNYVAYYSSVKMVSGVISSIWTSERKWKISFASFFGVVRSLPHDFRGSPISFIPCSKVHVFQSSPSNKLQKRRGLSRDTDFFLVARCCWLVTVKYGNTRTDDLATIKPGPPRARHVYPPERNPNADRIHFYSHSLSVTPS